MAEILFDDPVELEGQPRGVKDWAIRPKNYRYHIESVSNGSPIVIGCSLLIPRGEVEIKVKARVVSSDSQFDGRKYKGKIKAELRGGATYKAWVDVKNRANHLCFEEIHPQLNNTN